MSFPSEMLFSTIIGILNWDQENEQRNLGNKIKSFSSRKSYAQLKVRGSATKEERKQYWSGAHRLRSLPNLGRWEGAVTGGFCPQLLSKPLKRLLFVSGKRGRCPDLFNCDRN